MVWADGQLALAQQGHGPLPSPGGLRDGVLWAAVGSWEPEGRRAAAGTRGVPSLGCSAERVSFVLRFVRVNVGREGCPEGAPLCELPRWMVSENFVA